MNDFDWFVWIEHSTPRYCQGLVKYTLPLRHIQKYFAKQNIAIKTASNVKYLLLLAVYTLFDEVSNYLNLLHLRETHNALQLPVFFFSFFSFFASLIRNIGEFGSILFRVYSFFGYISEQVASKGNSLKPTW